MPVRTHETDFVRDEQRRDSINRELFAIRRLLRRMEAEQRLLAREARDLEAAEERAKREIEDCWRVWSGGWDPPRSWSWRPVTGGRATSRARRGPSSAPAHGTAPR